MEMSAIFRMELEESVWLSNSSLSHQYVKGSRGKWKGKSLINEDICQQIGKVWISGSLSGWHAKAPPVNLYYFCCLPVNLLNLLTFHFHRLSLPLEAVSMTILVTKHGMTLLGFLSGLSSPLIPKEFPNKGTSATFEVSGTDSVRGQDNVSWEFRSRIQRR